MGSRPLWCRTLRVRKYFIAVLAVTAVLGVAACGSDQPDATATPPAKQNAAAYDNLDVCAMPDDAALQAALGEAPAARTKRDDDSLKGCVIDGASHRFYLFVTVRRSPAGGKEQYGYDRSAAASPQPVPNVGAEAFAYNDANEAHVEALDGDLVIRVSMLFYADGGSVSAAPELTTRLSGLLKHLVAKV
jgi:hypothetical protein